MELFAWAAKHLCVCPSKNIGGNGVLAHLVERSYGIAEVASSSLAHSTKIELSNSLG